MPGMVAAHTVVPVLGVPVESHALKGMDSLLSIVQMPAGVPVATVGIGNGRNAGLLAARIIGAFDGVVAAKLTALRMELRASTAIARDIAVFDRLLKKRG